MLLLHFGSDHSGWWHTSLSFSVLEPLRLSLSNIECLGPLGPFWALLNLPLCILDSWACLELPFFLVVQPMVVEVSVYSLSCNQCHPLTKKCGSPCNGWKCYGHVCICVNCMFYLLQLFEDQQIPTLVFVEP